MRHLKPIARLAPVIAVVIAVSACGSTTTPANTGPGSSTSAVPSTTPDTTPGTTTPDTTTPDTTPDTTTPDTAPTTPPTNVEPADVADLVGRDWVVDGWITVAGLQPVPEGSTASLHFNQNSDGSGTVAVDSGCNTGTATVTYGPANAVTLGPIALTRKACSDELNALESTIVGVLEYSQLWAVDGDTLSLTPETVSDSGLRLHDAAGSAPDDSIPGRTAAETERLLGTDWVAQEFITVGPLDPIPADSGASLRFESTATVAVHTGCNQGTGTLQFNDDGSFTIEQLTLTEMACADDGLEQRIVALLQHPLQWGVNGDELSIYPLDVTDTGIILRDSATVSTAPPTTVSEADAAAAVRADVLAAAAVARITTDNSFGAQDTFAEVAIVELLGRDSGDGFIEGIAEGVALTGAEKARIEDALAPIVVRWTTDPQDPVVVTAQQAGQLSAILTLSEPLIVGDTASIVSGLFCGSLCGIGGAYTLERQSDGAWIVTDRPGPQWIS